MIPTNHSTRLENKSFYRCITHTASNLRSFSTRLVTPAVLALLGFSSCQHSSVKQADSVSAPAGDSSASSSLSIARTPWGKTKDGKEVSLYTLKNKNGISVSISTYGGIITSLFTPDKKGKSGDVVLGYDSLNQYFNPKDPYFGALVGRYANRIAGAKFVLDGKAYRLAANDHVNSLHGGLKGFDKVVWDAAELKGQDSVALQLKYSSANGEEGYPGNLKATVTYILNNANELKIDYQANTDKNTVLNLTNHSYFNLSAGASKTILNHELQINASKYTPVNKQLIPTGKLEAVASTPMDFSKSHKIGDQIDKIEGGGYDHNYVLDHKAGHLDLAASVFEPTSGRTLEIFTTQPGIQFYTGNFLDGSQIGKHHTPYTLHYAIALETQHFPDSPNQPAFPSVVLKPGQNYHELTVLRFSVRPDKK